MVEHIDPEHCEFGSVQLTHYVSPHEFWIKYKDDERASPDNEIQKRIARLVNSDFGYQPSIGEIVILRCFGTLNKLIRVRVDAELHSDNGSEFILWAIDEGYPIRSTKEFIAQLRSEELKNAGSQVYKVTLNSIVPANLVFNIEKGNSERFKTKCWSEKAINEFEKMLNGQLLFHYDCHADVDTQHIYGSLEVISPFGQIINMSTVMKKLDEAVDATDFDFEKQNLTHLSYWLKQHPNYKIKENIKGALSQEDSLSQTLQQCSLNETPLNKRSPLNKLPAQIETPQPPIDSTEPKETHSPKPTSPDIPATNSLHFRKALQEESSFSADVKKRLLCHFPNFPNKTSVRAISLVSEANFTDEVHDKLKSEISQVYRIQALGWPHLMRRSSLILINGPKSGKTWTYLPAVCSLLNEDHCDGKIESGDGPVIIIICLDSYSVKQILSRCHTLLSRQFCCEGGYGREEMEDLEYKLLNGFDVLVTTMPCLSRLMKDSLNFFNKKRITTVVFDDIDAMWDCFGESEVAKIREAFCLDPRIQVIITSKTWHKTLKKFCEKDDMLVCIGAYIEAAVYAKAEFQAEFTVMSSDKENVYKNFLSIFKEQNFDNERTVVICSESDEVIKINEYLKRDGYVCTFCHDKTDSSEIAKVNKLIEQNLFGELGVIVCTDDTLGDLVIRNAQHIIHFSLPKIWTTFTQRFAASFDYYKDFVCNKSNLGRPKSLIFVDAGNKETMPRIIDFMRFRCSANIPEHILKIAEKNRILREENRETQTVKFCENLLLFGKCYSQYTCKYRHTFTKFDRSHENVPTAGEIKFLILSTHTPTHYTVRLLEHRPHKGMPWHKIPRANEYFYLQRRLEQHFENVKDHSIVHAPKFGDLCVVDDRDDGDDESVFKRCEIVAINKNKSVELLLIDTNKRLHGISCMDLLQMPQYLKLFPRQAFELRIAGVAPQDFDVNWSSSSKKTVAQWVASAGCVQGEIELTVMNCIWVRSMKIIEKLQSISYEISPVDIKDKIIKYEFGVVEENAIKMLRKMAQRTGILNNNPNLLKPEILTTLRQSQERGRGRGKVFSQSSTDSINSSKHSVPVNQSYEAKLTVEEFSNSSGGTSTVEECWETLYRDTFYEVEIGEFYSPTNFYVVLANKLKGFRSLRRLIEKFTNKSTNLIPLSEVAVGRVCLAKVECSTEEETPRYERAKIMNIDETTVTIFLADYGSKMKVSVSDLMEIPEKFKKRFPFQAIFCKMVGVRPTNESGQWTDIENEAVYDILCEVGHDLFLHIAGSPNISEDVLKCNSYDVVLFDKSMMRNLNAFIVEENHAKFHPDTVNLIDVNVDYNRLGSEEENWDNYEFDDDDEYDDNEVKSSTQPNNLQAICSDESDTEWDVQISEEEARELLNLPKQPISRPENSQSTPPLPVPKEVETATTQSSVQIQKPFQLAQKAKVPYVIWSQTLQMVTMYISAADVSDYSLKVASRFVHLSFIKNNVRFEAVWNLNACVEPQFTRHEIRGLNIVVRLKKSLSAILWPRLVQSREKNQFITKKVDSNDDSDDVDENIRRGYNSNNNFVPSSSLSDNEEEFDDIDTSDVDLA